MQITHEKHKSTLHSFSIAVSICISMSTKRKFVRSVLRFSIMHKFGRIVSAGLFTSIIIFSPFANAFSGTGAGTSGNPYKVDSCIQLQNIENDPDAYYKQTGNIDCSDTVNWNSGAGFVPISSFSGTFDGQGYYISSLAIERNDANPAALFAVVSGATISDIHLSGGYVVNHDSSSYTGSLIGIAFNSNISNCSSTTSVEGSDGGGLISTIAGGTVDSCWYEGTTNLNGYRYAGGFSGLVMNNAVLSNIYSAGDIEARGGLLGVLGTGVTITDSYSTANVTYNDTAHAGGLFGSADGVISATLANDVFFDGTITAPSSIAVGKISGSLEAGATITNAYFQGSGTGIGDNSGGSGGGSGVNSGGSLAGHFKNNQTVAPLSSWDFTNKWRIATDYPQLRFDSPPNDGDGDGFSDAEEASSPHSGDANNDSIQDSNQTNVTTLFNDVSNRFTVLQSTCDSHFNIQNGGESSVDHDVAFDYPAGLLQFVLLCNSPGATATVTLYYYGDYDPTNLNLRKWNDNNSYTTIASATLSKVTIGGQNALKVQYQITDGSSLDQDGIVDGNIVDPVGIAVNMISAPNTGLSGGQ